MYETRKQHPYIHVKSGGQNVHRLKTSEQIAEEYGIDEKTVRRDAEFSKSVDKIANEIGENAKEAILSGQANDRKSK